MPEETKKSDTSLDFDELLSEYREGCKKQKELDKIILKKESELFEIEWIKAGLQIFYK